MEQGNSPLRNYILTHNLKLQMADLSSIYSSILMEDTSIYCGYLIKCNSCFSRISFNWIDWFFIHSIEQQILLASAMEVVSKIDFWGTRGLSFGNLKGTCMHWFDCSERWEELFMTYWLCKLIFIIVSLAAIHTLHFPPLHLTSNFLQREKGLISNAPTKGI